MANKMLDLTGQKVDGGRLTAIRRTDKKTPRGYYWLCKCDCGTEVLVQAWQFKRGLVKSCGCLRRREDVYN